MFKFSASNEYKLANKNRQLETRRNTNSSNSTKHTQHTQHTNNTQQHTTHTFTNTRHKKDEQIVCGVVFLQQGFGGGDVSAKAHQ